MFLGDLRIQNVQQDPASAAYSPTPYNFNQPLTYSDNNPSYPQENDPQKDSSFSQENPYIANENFNAYPEAGNDMLGQESWGNNPNPYAAEGGTVNDTTNQTPHAYGREFRDNRSNTFYDNVDRTHWQADAFRTQSGEPQAHWPANEQMSVEEFENHLRAFQSRSNKKRDNANAQVDTAVADVDVRDWSDDDASNAMAAENRWDASADTSWASPTNPPWSVDACEPCCMSTCGWGNFRVFGDFLYWDLCQNNLDFAVCAKNVSGVSSTSFIPVTTLLEARPVIDEVSLWYQGKFKIKPVSTKYKPGFRIGGFYSSLCSSWEFGIVYTQLHSHYCNRTRPNCDNALVLPTQLPTLADTAELFFRTDLGGVSPSAHSKLHFQYNMLDALFTTSYSNEGCLTWQPYIGARFLEIKERWNVRYAFTANSSSISLSEPFAAVSATSKWHSKLPTGGVTIGVGGAYNFCGCWNAIGRVGVSCVGGSAKQRTSLNATFATLSSSDALNPTCVTKRKCAILTGFEGALGIAYNLTCCKLGVQFGVGYEFQTWLNVPSPLEHGIVVPGIRHNSSTNLTVHGLFVRAGVSF